MLVTSPLLRAVCCVSLILSSGAWATAGELAAKRVTVPYDDLNLSTPEGAQVLYSRLQAAARQVCVAMVGRELSKIHAWKRCYRAALSDAVSDVGHVALSELHATGSNARVAQRPASNEPRS